MSTTDTAKQRMRRVWIAALAVATMGGLALLVYFLAARSGDGPPPAAPGTSPTPVAAAVTATATTAPAPTATMPAVPVMPVSSSFRDFAHRIEGALQAHDSGFFREAALTERVLCGAARVQRPETGCMTVGQEFDGLALSVWRSDAGGIAPLDEVVATIERLWAERLAGRGDDYGDAGPHVYALGTRFALRPATPALHVAVLTAIVQERGVPRRVAVVTFWHEVEGDWRYTHVLTAFVRGEEFLGTDGPGVKSGWMAAWERFDP